MVAIACRSISNSPVPSAASTSDVLSGFVELRRILHRAKLSLAVSKLAVLLRERRLYEFLGLIESLAELAQEPAPNKSYW